MGARQAGSRRHTKGTKGDDDKRGDLTDEYGQSECLDGPENTISEEEANIVSPTRSFLISGMGTRGEEGTVLLVDRSRRKTYSPKRDSF